MKKFYLKTFKRTLSFIRKHEKYIIKNVTYFEVAKSTDQNKTCLLDAG